MHGPSRVRPAQTRRGGEGLDWPNPLLPGSSRLKGRWPAPGSPCGGPHSAWLVLWPGVVTGVGGTGWGQGTAGRVDLASRQAISTPLAAGCPAPRCPAPQPPFEDRGGPRRGQQRPGPLQGPSRGGTWPGALHVGRRGRRPRDTPLEVVVGPGSPPPTPHRPLGQMGGTRGGWDPSAGSRPVAAGSPGSASPETSPRAPLRGLGSRSQPGRQQDHRGLPSQGTAPTKSRNGRGAGARESRHPRPRWSHVGALRTPSHYGLPLSRASDTKRLRGRRGNTFPFADWEPRSENLRVLCKAAGLPGRAGDSNSRLRSRLLPPKAGGAGVGRAFSRAAPWEM